MISTEAGQTSTCAAYAPRRRRTHLSRRRQLVGWLLAVLGPLLLAVLLSVGRQGFGLSSVLLLFLLLVVVVAAVGGLLPALLAAVSGSLLANFYFTPPIHTFTIAEGENLLAFVVFLVVGAVVSWLVSVASRRTADAAHARAEAETLAALGGTLVTTEDPLPQLVAQLHAAFTADAVAVLREMPDGTWEIEAVAGEPVPSRPEDGDFSVPIGPSEALVVVGQAISDEDLEVLRSFAAQVQVAVERRRLHADVEAAAGLAEANELRTALLAAVSHDLRTPLASIKASVTSLLQRDVDWTPEATREFLETIDEESDRLNALVGNLLDMSRLQTGAMQLVMRDVGLEEVVPRALDGLPDRPVPVVLDLPETLPRVHADAGLLERAVANIVDNARVWSAPDQTVRVEAGVVHEPRRLAGHRPRSRHPARRPRTGSSSRSSDSVTPANGTGVGLGLAVARGFVDAMGGELVVDDTPGGGVTMVLSLPAVDAVSRVLVVDDEPQIRRALGINLRARGYEVDLAETGEEALELAARRHPDVVVLDLGLPGIGGVEVIHGLRGWSQVPVIVLSVRDAEADKVAALDAGADDYVTKPFGMDELLARMRASLRRAAPTDEEAVVVTADFSIDLAAKRVKGADGEEVRLTPTEWHIVEVLVRHGGKLVPQKQLLQDVWGPAYETETNYLRVFMAQVRRKLEPDPSQPRYFITEPGMGYRFEGEAE